jgi:hypothetical protein
VSGLGRVVVTAWRGERQRAAVAVRRGEWQKSGTVSLGWIWDHICVQDHCFTQKLSLKGEKTQEYHTITGRYVLQASKKNQLYW